MVSTSIRDLDVFYLVTNEKMAYVNYLKVVNGAIMNTYTLEMTKNLNDNDNQLLSYAIMELREKFNSITSEIVLAERIDLPEDLEITVPKIGDKKKLLDLSKKNVTYYLLQQKKEAINNICLLYTSDAADE